LSLALYGFGVVIQPRNNFVDGFHDALYCSEIIDLRII